MTRSKAVGDLQILGSQGHIKSPGTNETLDVSDIEVVLFFRSANMGTKIWLRQTLKDSWAANLFLVPLYIFIPIRSSMVSLRWKDLCAAKFPRESA